eukprot:CAMPEP_0201723676 /NCGR_PEP_ID=MMETSP0593-20130828/7639_1 /ASSEMBLY_ACC=CAM_ASM_000672 /TAXON_ID=267983 /ORGANISM="Skeletonema japonicum, Strain CCMP2506" /LENGTH=815 /DNA_ID=CAMNT_0048214807 /DNA_START=30 /DNA_END=2477 /DNA_ORIENTATION=-
MNENQPSNRSRPAASSKKSGKLSASARKQKKKKGGRVSDFSKIIDEGQKYNSKSEKEPVAPQNGSLGNNLENEDVLSSWANQSANEFEIETTSNSEGVLTQDLAEINLDEILQHRNDNVKESSSSEGSSSHLTQEGLSSTTEDNLAPLPSAATLSRSSNYDNNNCTTNQSSKQQQPSSRTVSIDSTTPKKPPPLSAEQKAKIEGNRQRAKRLRALKQQQEKMNQQSPSNNEVAQKPHPHEAMRQDSENTGSTSTSTKAMKCNSEEADTASAGIDVPQDSAEPSTAPQTEKLSFYYDKEQGEHKESRRKSAGTTLTQQGFVERNVTKKRKMERETFPTDKHTAEWHRWNRDVLFLKGDVWLSHRPEFDGWAFLIEHIDLQNAVHVVKAHAFMKLEKTFIGQEEAEKLEYTGWVHVKKHDSLPTDGYIKLKDLSERMEKDIPFHMHLNNRHLSLRYEEDGDIVSYYVKKGKQLSTSLNNQHQQPGVCDCFAGGGGMSVGIREAGFFSDKSYKVDMDEKACETLRANFPESTVFQADIRDLIEKYRRGEINLFAPLIDWLHMSPPCQGFSRVNTSGGCKDLQNNECTLSCIELTRLLQPSHVTMENVPGILDEKQVSVAERTKRSYLQEFVGGLLSQEYQVRICKKLNAKNYGDPQDRERVIVFASKKGFVLPSPSPPTHGREPHLQDVVTVRDVLGDLECIEPTKDGKVWLNDGSLVRGHYSNDKKEKHDPDEELIPHLPARTVRKKNQLVHYNRKRNATILERARLMSFPDDYVFEGNQGVQSDQIGNAIPVCFATAIANAVKESFRLGLHEPPSS